MISLTHHNNVWHLESLYGVSWLRLTLKVSGGNPGSWLWWSMPTWWTTPQSVNLVSPSHDNCGLSWTVSIPVKGTAGPVERLGILQTQICAPVVRPKRCPTSSNPALIPNWMVFCLNFTLLMMLLLPGWPTMGLNRIRKKKNSWKVKSHATKATYGKQMF